MLDMGRGLSLSPVSIAHGADPGRHKGQIGDRSSHKELEERLRPPDVAGLAYAELHQPGQPLFAHRRMAQEGLPTIRRAAWYDKTRPTFTDALALVRKELWTKEETFGGSL